MYAGNDYIVSRENRDAYENICDFVENETTNLIIYGAEKSGKTHLLTIGKEKGGKKATLCSTTAIMLQFELGLGDGFFEMLGEIPLLFIDELELAQDQPETAKLLELMVLERIRKGLVTCFASRKPLNEMNLSNLMAATADFNEVSIEPLGINSIERAVKVFSENYKTNNDRVLSDSACAYIASSSEDLDEVRNKVQFLLQHADTDGATTIDEIMVKRLTE